MPLSLICACGARIELEDALAGQDIACPECQQPLKAPAAESQPVRTSAFALASLVMSLVGAFTLIGTVVAIILGLIGVVSILRNRDKVAGLGYAIAGIVLGFFFTLLTGVAFLAAEPFGFAGLVRERSMAEFVDTTGPIEVVNKNYALTRPTEKWGVARNGEDGKPIVNDPIAELFLKKGSPDVVLVQIKQNAFIDVSETSDPKLSIDQYQTQYLSDYQANEFEFGEEPAVKEEGFMRLSNGKTRKSRLPPTPTGYEGREIEMDLQAAGQKWVMIVRIYRSLPDDKAPLVKPGGKFYIVRAYTPRRWFNQNEPEFRKALDSFRIVK